MPLTLYMCSLLYDYTLRRFADHKIRDVTVWLYRLISVLVTLRADLAAVALMPKNVIDAILCRCPQKIVSD